eukprot:CFRG2566T1
MKIGGIKRVLDLNSKQPRQLLLTAGDKKPSYTGTHSGHYYEDFQHSMHELDDALRWRGYSMLKMMGSIAAIGTFYVYAFREEIKDTVSDVAADITSRTFEDDELIEKAGALSQSVVYQVLNDPATIEKSTEFITSLSAREDVKAAVVALLTLVANDPASIAKVKELLGAVVTQLMADDSMKQLFVEFSYWLITQESTSRALSALLAKTYKDPWFQETTNEFFGWVIASDPVLASSSKLAQQSLEATMADVDFQDKMAVFFQDVLTDRNLHEQGGKAMWEAFKFSLPGSGLFNRNRSHGSSSTSTAKESSETSDTVSTENTTRSTQDGDGGNLNGSESGSGNGNESTDEDGRGRGGGGKGDGGWSGLATSVMEDIDQPPSIVPAEQLNSIYHTTLVDSSLQRQPSIPNSIEVHNLSVNDKAKEDVLHSELVELSKDKNINLEENDVSRDIDVGHSVGDAVAEYIEDTMDAHQGDGSPILASQRTPTHTPSFTPTPTSTPTSVENTDTSTSSLSSERQPSLSTQRELASSASLFPQSTHPSQLQSLSVQSQISDFPIPPTPPLFSPKTYIDAMNTGNISDKTHQVSQPMRERQEMLLKRVNDRVKKRREAFVSDLHNQSFNIESLVEALDEYDSLVKYEKEEEDVTEYGMMDTRIGLGEGAEGKTTDYPPPPDKQQSRRHVHNESAKPSVDQVGPTSAATPTPKSPVANSSRPPKELLATYDSDDYPPTLSSCSATPVKTK